MFIPTALEKSILEFFLHDTASHTQEEILKALPNAAAAIEGCLAKGFLQQTDGGAYILTTAGKAAL